MITLTPQREPYVLTLPFEVRVTVRPLASSGWQLALVAARRTLEGLLEQSRQRRDAGLSPDPELPQADDPAGREGLLHLLFIKELAARHVTAWEGVVDAVGEALPATRENVMALMDLHPLGERFFEAFTVRHLALIAAKNGSRPSPAGTGEEGRAIAGAVMRPESLAPTVV